MNIKYTLVMLTKVGLFTMSKQHRLTNTLSQQQVSFCTSKETICGDSADISVSTSALKQSRNILNLSNSFFDIRLPEIYFRASIFILKNTIDIFKIYCQIVIQKIRQFPNSVIDKNFGHTPPL